MALSTPLTQVLAQPTQTKPKMKLRFGNPLYLPCPGSQKNLVLVLKFGGLREGQVEEGSRCKGEKLDPKVQIHSLETGLPTLNSKLAVTSKT